MDKKKNPVSFQLSRISTEQFAIIKENYTPEKEIGLGIHLKFGLDQEQKIIAPFVLVQLGIEDKPFLQIEIGAHFEIDDAAWQDFEVDQEKLVIPKGFAQHLVVITIGTLRGVLHSKTENTEYNKYLLPTINVTEIVESDIEISF